MQRLTVWLRLVAAVTCLSLAAGPATAQVAGKDFKLLNPPQPTESGKKVEVIEFFSYACPGCHALEAPLAAWLKRKPADVAFRRVPVVFRDSWLPYARLYYTLDAMGLTDKLHQDIFTAVHDQKIRLDDPKTLFDWVSRKGVDQQKFMDMYNSFTVQSLAQRAPDVSRRYDVDVTPAVVVDGRYLSGPSMIGDYERFFKVIDHLIAVSRKNRATK